MEMFPPSTLRPTPRELVRHSVLFGVTVFTTIYAGVMLAAPPIDPPAPPLATALDYLLYIPSYYVRLVFGLLVFAVRNPPVLVDGLIFSGTLLSILFAHEMGHYLACRWYRVDATLPFFIPAPPLFLAGTFGAFIKIRAPIPSRRALFDIGLAGPLAGFIVAVPISIAGILDLQPAEPIVGPAITFSDPILFRLIATVMGVELSDSLITPLYMAAWIGLLVTSLNLMPVGQLDGGHGVFALFGRQAHKLIGRTAFVVIAVVAVLGFAWYGSPSGFLYAVLLGIMLKVRHPEPAVIEPLGRGRIVVALLTLLVFVVSFCPFPIAIT